MFQLFKSLDDYSTVVLQVLERRETVDSIPGGMQLVSLEYGPQGDAMIITEIQLHHWVRSNEREAQGIIPELVGRLVAASVRKPNAIRFPRADSIGQSGEDGYLDTDTGFQPFVPDGISFWEIGTGANPAAKANSDYGNRTGATPEEN